MLAGMMDELGAEVRETVSNRLPWWGLLSRWALCILGTGSLVAAVATAGNTLLFLRVSVAETGTVVSNVRVDQRDSDGHITTNFTPEFTFTGADGKTYTVTSATSSNPPEFAEGQTVRVLYNPMNPGTARIDSFEQLWFAPILAGTFGIVLASVGYTWMYFRVKRNREILSIR